MSCGPAPPQTAGEPGRELGLQKCDSAQTAPASGGRRRFKVRSPSPAKSMFCKGEVKQPEIDWESFNVNDCLIVLAVVVEAIKFV